MKRLITSVAAAIALTVLIPGAAWADGQAPYDWDAIAGDLAAAELETAQANAVHAEAAASTASDNVTCGPVTPIAQGTPLIHAGPVFVTQEDVAGAESDCVSRDTGSPYVHSLSISFQYRRDGVWRDITDYPAQVCSKSSVKGVSVFADCFVSAEYPLYPTAHYSLGYPHRAKVVLTSPLRFPPAYSHPFMPSPADVSTLKYDQDGIYRTYCRTVWGQEPDNEYDPTRFPLNYALCVPPI